MPAKTNRANDAWEALLSAHAVLMKQFAAEDIWADVSMREYDVLYTLSKCPEPIRISELNWHSRGPAGRCSARSGASTPAAWPGP
jgi:hypothetical protein